MTNGGAPLPLRLRQVLAGISALKGNRACDVFADCVAVICITDLIQEIHLIGLSLSQSHISMSDYSRLRYAGGRVR